MKCFHVWTYYKKSSYDYSSCADSVLSAIDGNIVKSINLLDHQGSNRKCIMFYCSDRINDYSLDHMTNVINRIIEAAKAGKSIRYLKAMSNELKIASMPHQNKPYYGWFNEPKKEEKLEQPCCSIM